MTEERLMQLEKNYLIEKKELDRQIIELQDERDILFVGLDVARYNRFKTIVQEAKVTSNNAENRKTLKELLYFLIMNRKKGDKYYDVKEISLKAFKICAYIIDTLLIDDKKESVLHMSKEVLKTLQDIKYNINAPTFNYRFSLVFLEEATKYYNSTNKNKEDNIFLPKFFDEGKSSFINYLDKNMIIQKLKDNYKQIQQNEKQH